MLVWAAALVVAAQAASANPYSTFFPTPGPHAPLPAREAISFPHELAIWVTGPPIASYTSQPALLGAAQRVVAFYLVLSPGRTPRPFLARSLSSFGPRPMQPLWADSRTCPALIDRLKSLDDLHVEVSAPAGLNRRKAGMDLDGVEVTVRTSALGDGDYHYDIAVTSNGGALVAWAQKTNEALEACFSTAYPPDLKPPSTPEERAARFPAPNPATAPPPPGGPPSAASPAPRP